MMNAQADRPLVRPGHRTPHTRSFVPVLGGVLLWLLVLLASVVLWQRMFGFSAGEAWALAVGLFGYVGLLILAMVVLSLAVERER